MLTEEGGRGQVGDSRRNLGISRNHRMGQRIVTSTRRPFH